MPISTSEIQYQTPQADSNDFSRPTPDHGFSISDTHDRGGLDMSQGEEEEGDISHVKTTTHFDEYELGNVQPEDEYVAKNNDNDNDNDNTSMLDVYHISFLLFN